MLLEGGGGGGLGSIVKGGSYNVCLIVDIYIKLYGIIMWVYVIFFVFS